MLVRTTRFIGGAALLLAAVAAPAAAQVIDQQQTNASGNFGGSAFWSAQSFTPASNNSVGAGFFLTNGGNTGTAMIQLWNKLPDQNGATMLASATGVVNFTNSGGWVDGFWSAVSLTPGQQYFLAFTTAGSTAQGTTNSSSGGNLYAGGQPYYNYSGNVRDPYTYTNASLDLAFREYASTAVTTTPEPASMALLGTGLVGLVPMLRKRRNSKI